MTSNTLPVFYVVRAHILKRLGIEDPLTLLPDDVKRLVIASRQVVFDEADAAALKALDKAAEAFADRVPWDDAP